MNELPHSADYRAFARAPDDPIAGALLVARLVDEDTDETWVREELARLAASAGAADATALVAALSEAGFGGASAYYAAANSSLEQVLRSRRGIPITLAVVVLGVAVHSGLAARGINFPGHFLVEVGGLLVDPFRMAPLGDRERAAWLERAGLSAADALVEATPRDIVLRMLNNLRMLAVQRGDPARALDISSYQLLVATDPLPLHIDRVDLWLAAGVADMARRELDLALGLAQDDALRAHLAERRLALAGQTSRLH